MDVKHALITGGSRGLGESLAIALAKKGVKAITLVDVRDCQEAVSRVKEAGGDAITVQQFHGDVRDFKEMEEVVRTAEQAQGPIDLVAANAGIAHRPGHVSEISAEEYANVIGVNTLGVIYTVKAVLPGMLNRKKGHVLVVSSLAASYHPTGGAAYAVSKTGTKCFADMLRLETQGTGISVHLAMPPFIDTTMARDAWNDEYADKGILRWYERISGPFLKPEAVVDSWVRGIEQGHYTIWLPHFTSNIINHVATSLITPTPIWWPLDVLLSPFFAIFCHLNRFVASSLLLPHHTSRLRRGPAKKNKGKLEE